MGDQGHDLKDQQQYLEHKEPYPKPILEKEMRANDWPRHNKPAGAIASTPSAFSYASTKLSFFTEWSQENHVSGSVMNPASWMKPRNNGPRDNGVGPQDKYGDRYREEFGESDEVRVGMVGNDRNHSSMHSSRTAHGLVNNGPIDHPQGIDVIRKVDSFFSNMTDTVFGSRMGVSMAARDDATVGTRGYRHSENTGMTPRGGRGRSFGGGRHDHGDPPGRQLVLSQSFHPPEESDDMTAIEAEYRGREQLDTGTDLHHAPTALDEASIAEVSVLRNSVGNNGGGRWYEDRGRTGTGRRDDYYRDDVDENAIPVSYQAKSKYLRQEKSQKSPRRFSQWGYDRMEVNLSTASINGSPHLRRTPRVLNEEDQRKNLSTNRGRSRERGREWSHGKPPREKANNRSGRLGDNVEEDSQDWRRSGHETSRRNDNHRRSTSEPPQTETPHTFNSNQRRQWPPLAREEQRGQRELPDLQLHLPVTPRSIGDRNLPQSAGEYSRQAEFPRDPHNCNEERDDRGNYRTSYLEGDGDRFAPKRGKDTEQSLRDDEGHCIMYSRGDDDVNEYRRGDTRHLPRGEGRHTREENGNSSHLEQASYMEKEEKPLTPLPHGRGVRPPLTPSSILHKQGVNPGQQGCHRISNDNLPGTLVDKERIGRKEHQRLPHTPSRTPRAVLQPPKCLVSASTDPNKETWSTTEEQGSERLSIQAYQDNLQTRKKAQGLPEPAEDSISSIREEDSFSSISEELGIKSNAEKALCCLRCLVPSPAKKNKPKKEKVSKKKEHKNTKSPDELSTIAESKEKGSPEYQRTDTASRYSA